MTPTTGSDTNYGKLATKFNEKNFGYIIDSNYEFFTLFSLYVYYRNKRSLLLKWPSYLFFDKIADECL